MARTQKPNAAELVSLAIARLQSGAKESDVKKLVEGELSFYKNTPNYAKLVDTVMKKAHGRVGAVPPSKVVEPEIVSPLPAERRMFAAREPKEMIAQADAQKRMSAEETRRNAEELERRLTEMKKRKAYFLWLAAGKWAWEPELYAGKGRVKQRPPDEKTRKDEERYFYDRAEKILGKEAEAINRYRSGNISFNDIQFVLMEWAAKFFRDAPEEYSVFRSELNVLLGLTGPEGPKLLTGPEWETPTIRRRGRDVSPEGPTIALPGPPQKQIGYEAKELIGFRKPPLLEYKPQVPLECSIWESTETPKVGEVVEFRADVKGATPPYTYTWEFGDGNIARPKEATTSHKYSSRGIYSVTLTVRDNAGYEAKANAAKDVSMGEEGEAGKGIHVYDDRTKRRLPNVSIEVYIVPAKPPETYHGWTVPVVDIPTTLPPVAVNEIRSLSQKAAGVTDGNGFWRVPEDLRGHFYAVVEGYGDTKVIALTLPLTKLLNIPLRVEAHLIPPAGKPRAMKPAIMPFHFWRTFDPVTAAVHEARGDLQSEGTAYYNSFHKKKLEDLSREIKDEAAEEVRSAVEAQDANKTAEERKEARASRDAAKKRKAELENELTERSLNVEKYLKEHLRGKASGMLESLREKYHLSESQAVEVSTYLQSEADAAALRVSGKAAWYQKPVAYGFGAFGMSTSRVARNILTEYWGIWAAILAYFPFGAVGVFLALVAWGAFKLPWVFSVIILLTQISFLSGKALLPIIPQFPGYASTSSSFSNPAMLIVACLGGGLLNLVLSGRISTAAKGREKEENEEVSPLVYLMHVLAGAIITAGSIMLIASLQAFGGGVFFMAVAGIAIAFVIFVVYQPAGIPRGLDAINVLAIAVLIFSYFALGPYSAFVIETVDQVKAPFLTVEAAASSALNDVWLLVTNPTEYYAQQQLKAARPEHAMQFPTAVEITRLDAVPDGTVPGDSPFVIFVLVENQGDVTARDVTISATCVPGAPPEAVCRPSPQTSPSPNIDQLIPGSAVRRDFTFTAQGRFDVQRQGETTFDKVNITISYLLSTTSNLQVEVATDAEIQKRMQEKIGKVYYPQVAVAKVGPAQVGINVGPQPLTAGMPATIVFSISNGRNDGNVILDGSTLKVSMSSVVGAGLKCDSSVAYDASDCQHGSNTCTIVMKQHTVKSYGSVIPIRCTFVAAGDVVGSRTGLVTAKLDNYRFETAKQKTIQVGAPLGMLPPGGVAAVPTGGTVTLTSSQLSGIINQQMTGSSVTQDQVSQYLTSYAPAMAGQASNFFNLGKQYNIDPAFAIAVAMHESDHGTSAIARDCNNYFGIKPVGASVCPGHDVAAYYNAPYNGIEAFYRLISLNYVTKGQNTINTISCGSEAENFKPHCYVETGGIEPANWISGVAGYFGKISSAQPAATTQSVGTCLQINGRTRVGYRCQPPTSNNGQCFEGEKKVDLPCEEHAICCGPV